MKCIYMFLFYGRELISSMQVATKNDIKKDSVAYQLEDLKDQDLSNA